MNKNLKILLWTTVIAVILISFIYTVFNNQDFYREKGWKEIEIQDIKVTNTGVTILLCEEMIDMQKMQFVLVLPPEEIGSRLYKGKIKYKKWQGKYIFEPNP